MSMIGFTPQILGTEPRVPNFYGSASIIYDGKYLWVANRSYFGTDSSNAAKIKKLWVIDPSTGTPRVIQEIDLSAYTFNVVRGLSLSNNGSYVYVCLAGGTGAGHAGRCLVFNKTTFAIIGNAQMTTANIGTPGAVAGGRAVHALDDGADHLWVVNSNQSNGNAIERFSLAAVLANGTTATTSLQVVNVTQPNHVEEICYDGTYMYGSGSDYHSGCTRWVPSTGAISYSATTNLLWGPRYLAGALWGGDFSRAITRCDPSQFGAGGFQTDHAQIYFYNPGLSQASEEILGAVAYDGTYVWAASAFDNRNTQIAAGSNGVALPTSTINVNDTTPFPNSGAIKIGGYCVNYTSKDSTHFYGCTGGFGTMSTGQNVFALGVRLLKLSTTGGSVAVVATVDVYTGFNNVGCNNMCFDGKYIWAVQRGQNLTCCNLLQIDTTNGAEKMVQVWPTGGNLSQVI